MTGLYSRFEVRYRVRERPAIVHVWGWAGDRRELGQLFKGLAANPQLEHVETLDRRGLREPAPHELGAPARSGARPWLLL